MSYKRYKRARNCFDEIKTSFEGLRMGIRKWYSFGIHRFFNLEGARFW